MNEDNRRRRRRRENDSHRAFAHGVRWASLLTLGLPASLAAFGASATGQAPPMTIAWSLAGLAVTVCIVCWWRVVRLWRALPRPDDDDQGWWRHRPDGDPSSGGPDAGPGGTTFDWPRFEHEFWDHVERRRQPELV